MISHLIYIISENKEYSIEQLPLTSKNHENYMKAILFIDQNYQKDIHLEDIAKNLSFSNSYASRLFKRYTGVSFVKYLSMVRIRHSLEALLAGKDSIDEIAFHCGMTSSKALYGITPSIYHKQFQKNLKYNKEQRKQRMSLDQKQIELIQHLINEKRIYQDENLEITKENEEILYHYKQIDHASLKQEKNELMIKIKE